MNDEIIGQKIKNLEAGWGRMLKDKKKRRGLI
jgi:hypothetical protein